MLKLRLPYFRHLIGRAESLEKTLILVKIKGKRKRRKQRMRWIDSLTDSMDINFQETVEDRGAQHAACGHKELDMT